MKDIYYIFIIVATGVGSSLATMYLPTLKRAFKRVLTWFTPKSRTVVETEKPNYITVGEMHSLIEQINGALQNIDAKADEAIKYAKKRDSDRTAKTKQIVIDYLKELQK